MPLVQVCVVRQAARKVRGRMGIIDFQVGLSTIVALAPLLFKQSYLAVVFLKVRMKTLIDVSFLPELFCTSSNKIDVNKLK